MESSLPLSSLACGHLQCQGCKSLEKHMENNLLRNYICYFSSHGFCLCCGQIKNLCRLQRSPRLTQIFGTFWVEFIYSTTSIWFLASCRHFLWHSITHEKVAHTSRACFSRNLEKLDIIWFSSPCGTDGIFGAFYVSGGMFPTLPIMMDHRNI